MVMKTLEDEQYVVIKAYKFTVLEIWRDFNVLSYIACPRYPYIRVYRLYDKFAHFLVAIVKSLTTIALVWYRAAHAQLLWSQSLTCQSRFVVINLGSVGRKLYYLL